jgi:hypothetical protein
MNSIRQTNCSQFQNRRARTKKRIAQGKPVPQTRKTGSLAPTGHARRPGCCSQCRRPHMSPERLQAEPWDWDEDIYHQRNGNEPSVREILDWTEEDAIEVCSIHNSCQIHTLISYSSTLWITLKNPMMPSQHLLRKRVYAISRRVSPLQSGPENRWSQSQHSLSAKRKSISCTRNLGISI